VRIATGQSAIYQDVDQFALAVIVSGHLPGGIVQAIRDSISSAVISSDALPQSDSKAMKRKKRMNYSHRSLGSFLLHLADYLENFDIT